MSVPVDRVEALTTLLDNIGPRPRRSCRRCRERKVKCDRQLPCSQCVDNGVHAACSYPPGRGRAQKIPRKVLNEHLSTRLTRLETLLRRVEDHSPLPQPISNNQPAAGGSNSSASSTSSPPADLTELLIGDKGSFFISNCLWSSLSHEIVELRAILDTSSSDDEDDACQLARGEKEPCTTNSVIFGLRSASHSPRAFWPHVSQFGTLFGAFVENVNPIVRIFHLPSLTSLFWASVVSPNGDKANDRDNEALVFAICYAAIVSLTPEKAINSLGISRSALLEQFRYGTEQAIARADLLNTQSTVLLSALALFLFTLRNQGDTRTSASLTALLLHLAQNIGLHRDGVAFQLSPLEVESRRRLWWHICLLDGRSAEYLDRATSWRDSYTCFDTKLPLHINDADLSPGMTTAPPERTGHCDMTLCVIRCEATLALKRMHNAQLSLAERQGVLKTMQTELEDRFVRRMDLDQPYQAFITLVARMIIARSGLIMLHYQHMQETGGKGMEKPQGQEIRDARFAQAIEVLECAVQLLTDAKFAPWLWHCRTQIQWYTIAFVLSEICRRPPSIQCERAWRCVSKVYNECGEQARQGALWKPLQKLMTRALFVRGRQEQHTHRHDFSSDVGDSLDGIPELARGSTGSSKQMQRIQRHDRNTLASHFPSNMQTHRIDGRLEDEMFLTRAAFVHETGIHNDLAMCQPPQQQFSMGPLPIASAEQDTIGSLPDWLMVEDPLLCDFEMLGGWAGKDS